MTGAPRPRRSSADPYGIGPLAPFLVPLAALVGLIVVAVATVSLVNGNLPIPGQGSGGGGDGGGGGTKTPAPSNVVIVDPRTNVPGSIVYAKAGNIWVQSGTKATQVTSSGNASSPSWSPDGQWIYYIDSVDEIGLFPAGGAARRYAMTYPNLIRVHPDGTGAEKLATGRFRTGRYTWFFWVRDPAVSPDGTTVAVVSDGPKPAETDIVLQLFDVAKKTFTNLKLAENRPYGHQDPAWRPDGRILLYVKNGREGARGAPAIFRYDVTTKRTSAVTGPGYLAPAWSPDGRFIAATRTGGFGTDVVILDGQTGAELARVTSDGESWAPTWSPKGDALAFLHVSSGIVDLRTVPITGEGAAWTFGDPLNLTEVSGLDGQSRPDWYIPADQLPAPTPTPAASQASTAPSASGTP